MPPAALYPRIAFVKRDWDRCCCHTGVDADALSACTCRTERDSARASERERERERQTDRQTDRQADRQTDRGQRQRDREREMIDRGRESERQMLCALRREHLRAHVYEALSC